MTDSTKTVKRHLSMGAWYSSVNMWCSLIMALLWGTLMIGFGLVSCHYTEWLDGSFYWMKVNSISSITCGGMYLLVGLGSVVLFILSFHIIGQCLSCIWCCCSCSTCITFFVISILILACGLGEASSLQSLSPEVIDAIEHDVSQTTLKSTHN